MKIENRLNGFLRDGAEETVGNGSRITSVDLNHRAEATVLMRSLRVIQGVARLELAGRFHQKLCQKKKQETFELATQIIDYLI